MVAAILYRHRQDMGPIQCITGDPLMGGTPHSIKEVMVPQLIPVEGPREVMLKGRRVVMVEDTITMATGVVATTTNIGQRENGATMRKRGKGWKRDRGF